MLYAKSAGAVESRRAVESAESRLDEAVKLNPRFEQAILLLSELKIRKGVPAPAVDLLVPLIRNGRRSLRRTTCSAPPIWPNKRRTMR